MPRLVVLLLLALGLAAGCSAPSETLVVVERPDPPPAAEEPLPPSPEMVPPGEASPAPFDTVQVGRFDYGKMWTFDNVPVDYFEEAYGFRPDTTWLNRARLGALRFADYCSASFVSPSGLVLTNHHCARESITDVSGEGEDLLESGFYAEALTAERAVEDLYVDQLLAIADVTDRVESVTGYLVDDDRRAQRVAQRTEEIETQLTDQAKGRDSTLYVEVKPLYGGARFVAHTYRRYDDVRLVFAPEQDIGYFGGDPDNFTYPRFTLDMALFRVYDAAGEPITPPVYFPFSLDGVTEGAPVFVVGNPAVTNRYTTAAELDFLRRYDLPQLLAVLNRRATIFADYLEANPDSAAAYDLENTFFSLRNSIKASEGELVGLNEEGFIARRRAADRQLQARIMAVDTLRQRYGDVLARIEQVQRSKEATVSLARPFAGFGNPQADAPVVLRALYLYFYDFWKTRGVGAPGLADYLEGLREPLFEVESLPRELEVELLAARLEELRAALGPSDPSVRRILSGLTPEARARQVIQNTALTDTAGVRMRLDEGFLGSDDAAAALIQAIAPLYERLNDQVSNFSARETYLNSRLALARLGSEGALLAPDATFSLRLADGVVRGYPYNGTRAPWRTTFYGLYNHYHSYGRVEPWSLPERWLSPPPTFDPQTPLNFVMTNDITGGNSGSAVINPRLQLVGLAFDSNIQALPNDYLYTDEEARAIAVDARGMIEALDDIYDADRLVLELTTGRFVPTEAEADEAEAAVGG